MSELIAFMMLTACGLAYGFLLLCVMRCASGGEWPWEVMAEQQRESERYDRELRRYKDRSGKK